MDSNEGLASIGLGEAKQRRVGGVAIGVSAVYQRVQSLRGLNGTLSGQIHPTSGNSKAELKQGNKDSIWRMKSA